MHPPSAVPDIGKKSLKREDAPDVGDFTPPDGLCPGRHHAPPPLIHLLLLHLVLIRYLMCLGRSVSLWRV
jgi:hypothetical protein